MNTQYISTQHHNAPLGLQYSSHSSLRIHHHFRKQGLLWRLRLLDPRIPSELPAFAIAPAIPRVAISECFADGLFHSLVSVILQLTVTGDPPVRIWRLFDHLILFEYYSHLRTRQNPQLPTYIPDFEIYTLPPIQTVTQLSSHQDPEHDQTTQLKRISRSRQNQHTGEEESSKSYDRSHGVTSSRFVYR